MEESKRLRGDLAGIGEMKRIHLIRHGQSRSQTGEDKDGVDPELSTLGIQRPGGLLSH